MNYVLIVVISETDDGVLLMHKNRGPACTINKFNCPGGKVKDNERYIDAAIRELREETGIVRNGLTQLVTEIFPDGAILHVFSTKLEPGENFIQIEDEPLMWFCINDLTDVGNKLLAGYGNVPYFINLAKLALEP